MKRDKDEGWRKIKIKRLKEENLKDVQIKI